MRLLLFRHGLTAGNLERRYIGVTDEPLCPEGREALRAQPRWEGVTDVWVTPTRRTAETALILFPNAVQQVCPGLAEMNFGEFENQSWEQLSGNPRYQKWLDTGCETPCPGGESREQFVRRCCAAFEELVEQALDDGRDDPLCVVAHGGTVMALLSVYAQNRADYFSYQTPCGGHWVLGLDRNGWRQNHRRTLRILQHPRL